MEEIVKTRNKPKVMQNGTMTTRQIEKKVGNAWAVLKNPVFERGLLVSAELLYYSADKAEAREEYRKQVSKVKKGHFAFFYMGIPDPNVIYIL